MKPVLTTERYRKLHSMTREQQAEYLKSEGVPDSVALDLLDNLPANASVNSSIQTESSGFSDSKEFQEILKRQESLKTSHLSESIDTQDEQERRFQRDILVNQFLLGGSTRDDEASFNNPNLKKTGALAWFLDIFRHSEKQAALVIGEKGAGKTWAALAYMNSVTRVTGSLSKLTHADAMFVTAFKLAEWFHNSRKWENKLDEVIRKKHLLIDDLGAEPSGFRGSDFIAFFDYLFSERHKFRRHTYITSNATVDQIRELYGDRFVSRFNETGLRYETAGPDLRQPE